MQKYKYLEDLGLARRNCGVNIYPQYACCKKEQEKYGLDRRATIDTAHSFAEWLYTCLNLYKDTAGKKIALDQTFLREDGSSTPTLNDMLESILEPLEVYLLLYKSTDLNSTAHKMAEQMLHQAIGAWNKYFMYLNW